MQLLKIGKVAVLTLALATGVKAFWRMECQGRLTNARLDPLVNPGMASTHAHVVHGGSGFSATSSYEDLRKSECSSCRVPEDLSAYWTPTLYFQDGVTNTYEMVPQVGGMLAYYFLRDDNITAFPAGFEMISGDTERRNFTAGNPFEPDPDQSHWKAWHEDTQDKLAQRAIGFNCLNYQGPAEGSLFRHYMPDKEYLDANCLDGVRAELMFPYCWNGKDVTAPDHKSHVAYADLVMNGDCPDEFPVKLPGLFYETIWDTYHYANRTGHFVWSNGDTTGYGYHGDFMMGWDPVFLDAAVSQCTNLTGQIEDCPVFAPTVVTQQEAAQCVIPDDRLPAFVVGEDTFGPMANLPGNPGAVPSVAPAPSGALSYAPGTSPSAPGDFNIGDAFKEIPAPSTLTVTRSLHPAEVTITRGRMQPATRTETLTTRTTTTISPPVPFDTYTGPTLWETVFPRPTTPFTVYYTESDTISEQVWTEYFITRTYTTYTEVTTTQNLTWIVPSVVVNPTAHRRLARHGGHHGGHHGH